MPTIEEQISEIPSQLRRAIKALSEDARLAIIIILLKNGEMTFSELSRALTMSSSNLTHHLKKLTQAALIENFFQRKENTEEYSFYRATLLAEDFTRNLLQPQEAVTPDAFIYPRTVPENLVIIR
jgi:DNA-binding transcriptional ArsR family regulator